MANENMPSSIILNLERKVRFQLNGEDVEGSVRITEIEYVGRRRSGFATGLSIIFILTPYRFQETILWKL